MRLQIYKKIYKKKRMMDEIPKIIAQNSENRIKKIGNEAKATDVIVATTGSFILPVPVSHAKTEINVKPTNPYNIPARHSNEHNNDITSPTITAQMPPGCPMIVLFISSMSSSSFLFCSSMSFCGFILILLKNSQCLLPLE